MLLTFSHVRLPILVFITSSMGLLAPAEVSSEIDQARMQRDVRIMEDVLRNLFDSHCSHFYHVALAGPQPQVRGMYLADYGLLFIVEDGFGYCANPAGIAVAGRESDELKRMAKIASEKHGRAGGHVPADSTLQQVQETIIEFFDSYADAISQLSDTDRIAVVVTPNQEDSPLGASLARVIHYRHKESIERQMRSMVPDSLANQLPRATANVPSASAFALPGGLVGIPQQFPTLVTTIEKRSVSAYHKGKISADEFRQRIDFSRRDTETPEMKRIKIMSVILKSGLNLQGEMVSGSYVDGLGALFFIESWGYDMANLETSSAAKQTAPYEALKMEILQLVADYGASLRILKPREHMIVEVRFPHVPLHSTSYRRLLLKARKADIDAYDRGKIDIEGFRAKVEFVET